MSLRSAGQSRKGGGIVIRHLAQMSDGGCVITKASLILSLAVAAALAAPAPARSEEQAQEKWGLALRDLDARTAQQFGLNPGDGVLVTAVQPGSAADRAGIQRGDIIQEVNRKKVASVKEMQAEAQKDPNAQTLLLLFRRGNSSQFAALELK